MEWCLIESDPGVFTELVTKFGVKGLQVEEVLTLDDEILSSSKEVHGLIFLFKWTKDTAYTGMSDMTVPNMFFAKQVITNACATQAILNVLLNIDVDLGDELTQFHQFTKDFDPEMRGHAISNSDTLRTVHNSFAKTEYALFDDQQAPKSQDLFHFVGYVPFKGNVYELDGLKEGPVLLGNCLDDGSNWLDVVKPCLQERMNKFAESGPEIRFNLMGIIKDRLVSCREKLDHLQSTGNSDPLVIAKLQEELIVEQAKRDRYKKENQRRKHNFVPLIYNLLRLMAKEKLLQPAIDQAKEQENSKKRKNTDPQ
eukprot:Lithocolla_globosa_v1_NODE_2905_length_1831_cov_42.489853.p1 type:complete len:311 gc:universal NODE_2905_length_1831_cov_42.489853:1041-109(-)